jgi:hypothetical protein
MGGVWHLEREAQAVDIDSLFCVWERTGVQPEAQLETPQQTEPLTMKERDRFHIPGHWAHIDEPHAKSAGFGDGLLRKPSTDAPIAMRRADDDRLELRLFMFDEETAEPDELALQHGDPEFRESRMGEVLIEFHSGVGPADGGIAVDVPMALRQRAPQVAAGIHISRCVLADDH